MRKGHERAGEREIAPLFNEVGDISITRWNRDGGGDDYITISFRGRMQDNRYGSFWVSVAVDPIELAEKLGELFPGITIL